MECKVLKTYKCFDKKHLSFIHELCDIIESHTLFSHPFFKDYLNGSLDKDLEKKWLLQRQFLSKCFPAVYANIISNTQDLEFIRPFVGQLWEELGQGKKDQIHYYQLLNTLNSKGISNFEINDEIALPSTLALVNCYNKWTKHENVIVAGGVFGFGIEPIIAMDMELSITGLRKKGAISESDLVYFQDHATHDYGHSWQIMDTVLPRIKSQNELDLIKEGVKELLDIRVNFYNCLIP